MGNFPKLKIDKFRIDARIRILQDSRHVTLHRDPYAIPEGLMAEALMTAEEVSKVLQIGLSTVYLLLQRGEIGSVRIGRSVRIRPLDLNEFIDSRARGEGASIQGDWNLHANMDRGDAP